MKKNIIIAIVLGVFALIGLTVFVFFPNVIGMGSKKRALGCGATYDFDWVGGNQIIGSGDSRRFAGVHVTGINLAELGLQAGEKVEILDGPYKGAHVIQQIGSDDGLSYLDSMFVIPVEKTQSSPPGKWRLVC